ncbi:cytochrome c3 family protein [Amaricoccus sp.]|uniref:cytochrome c3 family protein n=1 Tax=Amaricoccus sp. TaxID=1872485 RepID=UPI00260E89A5|nr:cytochrome c3 family protein [Amaricoccus sp.]HRO12972.1 cytochrome c3 family protein [Amaricoccus sp.]
MKARSGTLRLPAIRLWAMLFAAVILSPLPAVAQDAPPAADEVMIPASRVPFFHDWARSPHAKRDARAFNNWNEDGEIPETCARCHSTPGFLDYIGADGSAAGVVERKAPVGTVIGCGACHNETTRQMSAVTFPSGLRVEGLGAEARCMTCHQGRTSGASVAAAVAGHGEDAVVPELEFINVHYRAAGATLMGTLARGGYEYPGRSYASQRRHAAPFNTCISCHELHTTTPRSEPCAACHDGVTDRKSLASIRKGKVDFDGDGDLSEGIAAEVGHLHERLLAAIQSYAKEVAGAAIGYDGHAHPYFFNDSDADGAIGEAEAKMPNKYASWTPRLLKAAYNYQFVATDPGAYAHNAPYVVQLMHDSLADLSEANVQGLVRP